MGTVSVDVLLPSGNQQDVAGISSRNREANAVTNLENKSLPDL